MLCPKFMPGDHMVFRPHDGIDPVCVILREPPASGLLLVGKDLPRSTHTAQQTGTPYSKGAQLSIIVLERLLDGAIPNRETSLDVLCYPRANQSGGNWGSHVVRPPPIFVLPVSTSRNRLRISLGPDEWSALRSPIFDTSLAVQAGCALALLDPGELSSTLQVAW
jgi:hypothetical protein